MSHTGTGSPGKQFLHQACRSSRGVWTVHLVTWSEFWGRPVRRQELDSMILVGPFQLGIFYDSMILRFSLPLERGECRRAARCPGSAPCPASRGPPSPALTHRCRFHASCSCSGPCSVARQGLGRKLPSEPRRPQPGQPGCTSLPLSRAGPGKGRWVREKGGTEQGAPPAHMQGHGAAQGPWGPRPGGL